MEPSPPFYTIPMTIETFRLGNLDTNAYLVTGEGPDCWVFDCPDGEDPLLEAIVGRALTPRGLFLTHAHGDHIAGLNGFRSHYPGVPVFQHRAEAGWLDDPEANLSSWIGDPVRVGKSEGYLEEGQRVPVGPWAMRVLWVPGHSPGSLAYWFEDCQELFAGDVLFRSGVGRWDFPGSDRDALRSSLGRLCGLPDATRVRPGHGGSTTIGREKASNPYLRSDEPW